MRTYFTATVILALILFSVTDNISAIEMAPRISDREIIERLTRVEEGLKRLEDGQKALQQQIADSKDSTNRQISDLKDGQAKLEGRMDTLIYAVLGCFIALIGIVIWDRRTALSPAIKKNKELNALHNFVFKEIRKLP